MPHGPYCTACSDPARCGLGDMCLDKLPRLRAREAMLTETSTPYGLGDGDAVGAALERADR